MNLDEDAVRAALRALHDNSLGRSGSAADSRVTKYEHRLQEAFNFDRRETPIFCELLLRCPQTRGELRGLAERMHHFDDLSEVQSGLQRLMSREPALVKVLARQPGTKESRYIHLLSGDAEPGVSSVVPDAPVATGRDDAEKFSQLQSEVAELRGEIAELKQQFAPFPNQFN